MSRFVFAIAAYATLLIQTSVEPAWQLLDVSPALLLILAVFIGQCGPSVAALGAALILGLLADTLARPYPQAGVLIGPYTLGYTVGIYAVLQFRNLLFRNSIVTLAVMTLLAGGFSELVATALLSVRGLSFLTNHPAPDFSATAHLGQGLFRTLYTAAVSLPVGWLLLRSRNSWRFGHG